KPVCQAEAGEAGTAAQSMQACRMLADDEAPVCGPYRDSHGRSIGETPMNRCRTLLKAPLLFGALALCAGTAFGQSAKDLVGPYRIVAATVVEGDKKIEAFGPSPKGMMMLDANGRFMIVLLRPGLPKIRI